jgi:glycosyltransferase involved in cell wall biosynthesis
MAGQLRRVAAHRDPGEATRHAGGAAASAPRALGAALDLAVVVYDLRSSGVVRNVLRIAETARASGLVTELWLVHSAGALVTELPVSLTVRAMGAPSSRLPRAVHSLANLPRFLGLLRTHRPALLLSAGNHMHAFACLAHRLARVPGTRLIGRVSNALAAAIVPQRPGIAAALLRRAAMMYERIQYRSMHHLATVSQELARDLEYLAGVDPRRITVIANGVDLANIACQSSQPNDHPWFNAGAPPVVVAVGRHCRQKNFAHLLRAFARLRGRIDARLVILGEGEAQARARLQRLASALGVSDDVWLAGFQPNPYRFLVRARLFVLSSRWEGASNALIEALACGCPVVATACPTGVREVLTDDRVGALVPVDDVAALAEAMHARLVRPHDPDSSRRRAATYRLPQTLAAYLALLRRELAVVRDGAEGRGGTTRGPRYRIRSTRRTGGVGVPVASSPRDAGEPQRAARRDAAALQSGVPPASRPAPG